MTIWSPDSQLDSYEATTLALPDQPCYAGEPADSLCATLVRRNQPSSSRAVLYVHGWSDYFFQTELADQMTSAGYDFYAIDLRRYGRSLREGQLAGFTTDLSEYYLELDEAVRIIREEEGHSEIVLMAHSTGGLIASLWANDRPGEFAAVVLNSPWLELHSTPALRSALQPMFSAVRTLSPTAALPLGENGFYQRTISAEMEGQWHYNQNLKGDKAFVTRVGWISAVMAGQARVAAGLAIEAPVLCLLAERSNFSRRWSDDVFKADIVLDVDLLAGRAVLLGNSVTVVRIQDGIHDLALSREPARAQFYAELTRWLRTYG